MSTAHGNPMADYTCTGPASLARVRAAGLLDLLAAAVVAMIAVPQPVIRQSIMGAHATPVGIVVFVIALIAAILAVYWLYLAFSAVSWGRTAAMYLLDLGLDAPTKPTLGEASAWAAGWVLASGPALVGVRASYDPVTGLPARFSAVTTCSTAPQVTSTS